MKTIKKCCYNCKNIDSNINIYQEISYYCSIAEGYKGIKDNEIESCEKFSINNKKNKYIIEESNTKK